MFARYRNAALMGAGMYAARKVYKPAIDSVARYVSTAVKGRRKSIRTGPRRKGVVLTSQRDVTTRNVRQRQSKGFLKFQRRVRQALQADQPRQIYTSQYKTVKDTTSVGTDDSLSVGGILLAAEGVQYQSDMWNIFKDAYTLSAREDAESYKIHLKSAGLDLTFRNLSSTDQVSISLYFCRARQDQPREATVADSIPEAKWLEYFADMTSVGTVSATKPEMTPYMNANWTRYWKIYKNQELVIKPLEFVDLQLGRKYNRIVNGKRIQDVDVTKGTMMVFYMIRGAPQTSVTSASGFGQHKVSVIALKTYNYAEVVGPQTKDEIGQTE